MDALGNCQVFLMKEKQISPGISKFSDSEQVAEFALKDVLIIHLLIKQKSQDFDLSEIVCSCWNFAFNH